jgi:23S rRNA pseudouridine2605 synthase
MMANPRLPLLRTNDPMPSRSRPVAPRPAGPPPAGDRLQKVLAAAGLGSRRECEELILAGRVEVDRQVVSELGARVDPQEQAIRVDGQPIKLARRLYYAVHKPPGLLSTNRDPSGRPRVIDLIGGDQRLYAVGRLDKSSEGLIIVTNDGDLADRLTHPRFGVEKTYAVQVAGRLEPPMLEKLKAGVHLAEGLARVRRVRIKGRHKQSTILEIVLDEGRNREIRRLLASVGHKVQRLRRIAVGPVRLGELAPGEYRPLTREELQALRGATPGKERAPKPAGGKRRRPGKTALARPKRPGPRPGGAKAGPPRGKPPGGRKGVRRLGGRGRQK